MRSNRISIVLGSLAFGTCVAIAGCLSSETFIMVQKFDVPQRYQPYIAIVDVTKNALWAEHKDIIGHVDAVGFELYLSSTFDSARFDAFVTPYSGSGWPIGIPPNALQIMSNLNVEPGKTHVTYAEFLNSMSHAEELRSAVKGGKFVFYAHITIARPGELRIDSAKIVLTVSTN